jgi:hypothetical protein
MVTKRDLYAAICNMYLVAALITPELLIAVVALFIAALWLIAAILKREASNGD